MLPLLCWTLVVGGVLAVVLLPAAFYLAAVGSRRGYRCPHCGERITTEYLQATHCSMCGSPLKEIEQGEFAR